VSYSSAEQLPDSTIDAYGLVIDRDLNTAISIGLIEVGRGTPGWPAEIPVGYLQSGGINRVR